MVKKQMEIAVRRNKIELDRTILQIDGCSFCLSNAEVKMLAEWLIEANAEIESEQGVTVRMKW